MTTAEALAGAKSRLSIDSTVTTFDALLGQYSLDSVDRLAPAVYREVPPFVVPSVSAVISASGEVIIDISTLGTALDDVRRVEIDEGSGYARVDEMYLHGTTLTIRNVGRSSNASFKVYGLKAYTLADLPKWLNLAIFFYMMSEFYNMLAGDKSRYNVYMQNGGPAVDDMLQLANDYEVRAAEYVEEKSSIYGR